MDDNTSRSPQSPSSAATEGLSDEELAVEGAEELPDREAMSIIHGHIGMGPANVAIPINEATAANINSSDSVAIADADQIIILDQIADSADD
jgi:hypothetical protein